MVRALALHRLARDDEARAEFARGIALMNEIAPTPSTGVEYEGGPRRRWVLHAMYRILLSEAETVFGAADAATSQRVPATDESELTALPPPPPSAVRQPR